MPSIESVIAHSWTGIPTAPASRDPYALMAHHACCMMPFALSPESPSALEKRTPACRASPTETETLVISLPSTAVATSRSPSPRPANPGLPTDGPLADSPAGSLDPKKGETKRERRQQGDHAVHDARLQQPKGFSGRSQHLAARRSPGADRRDRRRRDRRAVDQGSPSSTPLRPTVSAPLSGCRPALGVAAVGPVIATKGGVRPVDGRRSATTRAPPGSARQSRRACRRSTQRSSTSTRPTGPTPGRPSKKLPRPSPHS